MVTSGEMSWDDDSNFAGKGKKDNNKDLYLRLKDGDNFIRLVTRPHQYATHRGIKKVGEKGFGRKIPCSKETGPCPLCDKGFKATTRWLLGVIDRETGTYKVLDISYIVFADIKKYNKSTIWGDPMKYDINIIMDRNGGATGYYTVQPIPHKPLSPQDQVIKDDVNFEYLKERVAPLKAEIVQKIMDKSFGPNPDLVLPEVKEVKAASKSAATVDDSNDSSDDLADIFPAYIPPN